ALVVVQERSLLAQSADSAYAANHQVGAGRFKRPSPAIGTLHVLRSERRRFAASKRTVKRHRAGVSRKNGRLASGLDHHPHVTSSAPQAVFQTIQVLLEGSRSPAIAASAAR